MLSKFSAIVKPPRQQKNNGFNINLRNKFNFLRVSPAGGSGRGSLERLSLIIQS
ncbi:MAG: hypothetical protein MPK62_03265 [Alphaproteobacteria bacterium]|nr:hypothetical protein [Alphaproteobacteria bacterium]